MPVKTDRPAIFSITVLLEIRVFVIVTFDVPGSLILLVLGLWLTNYENIGGQLWPWWGEAEPSPTSLCSQSQLIPYISW